jgi:hypothetical protein
MLEHVDSRARDIALHAIAYADYPAFLPILARLADSDPDMEIRKLATTTRNAVAARGAEAG